MNFNTNFGFLPTVNDIKAYVEQVYGFKVHSAYVGQVKGKLGKPVLESDLEKALVEHIEKFLLELGKGFMFVGTQQRITLGNEHYYVDMVFYNKILHSYVLIELKTKKFMPAAVGQLNMYLN